MPRCPSWGLGPSTPESDRDVVQITIDTSLQAAPLSRKISRTHSISPRDTPVILTEDQIRRRLNEPTFRLPPFPLLATSSHPLFTIIQRHPEEIDLDSEEEENVDRRRLSILFHECDDSVATALFFAFYHEPQVQITTRPLEDFFASIQLNLQLRKKTKRLSWRSLSPSRGGLDGSLDASNSNSESEMDHGLDEIDLRTPGKHSMMSFLTPLKNTVKKGARRTLARSGEGAGSLLSRSGSIESPQCLTVLCSPTGEILSPQYRDILSQLFEEPVTDILQRRADKESLGEFAPHHCVLLPTISKHLSWVCFVVASDSPQRRDSYALFWSVLVAVWNYNATAAYDDRIDSMICPSFHFAEDEVPANAIPENTASQLHVAYRSFVSVLDIHPARSAILRQKKQRVKLTQSLSLNLPAIQSVRNTLLLFALLQKRVIARDFISLSEAKLLIELVSDMSQSNDSVLYFFPEELHAELRQTAAETLAYYTFPNQRHPNLREMVLRSCLKEMLELAVEGKIRVHREINPADVQFGKRLAAGAVGVIFKGMYEDTPVAIKTFREFCSKEEREEFWREVAITSMLQHPNLVSCYGAKTIPTSKEDQELFIVISLQERGNLRDLLDNAEEAASLTRDVRLNLAFQIAQGMDYLHQMGILHRDLKSLNVLVGDDWRAHIIDFGTSRYQSQTSEMTSLLGTTMWMAPEMFIRGRKYDSAVDVYSFGIVLWEILTLDKPYRGENHWNIPERVKNGERPSTAALSEWDPTLVKLIKRCWHQKPSKRPTFPEILESLRLWLSMLIRRSESAKNVAIKSMTSGSLEQYRSSVRKNSARGQREETDAYESDSLVVPRVGRRRSRSRERGKRATYTPDVEVPTPTVQRLKKKRSRPAIVVEEEQMVGDSEDDSQ